MEVGFFGENRAFYRFYEVRAFLQHEAAKNKLRSCLQHEAAKKKCKYVCHKNCRRLIYWSTLAIKTVVDWFIDVSVCLRSGASVSPGPSRPGENKEPSPGLTEGSRLQKKHKTDIFCNLIDSPKLKIYLWVPNYYLNQFIWRQLWIKFCGRDISSVAPRRYDRNDEISRLWRPKS